MKYILFLVLLFPSQLLAQDAGCAVGDTDCIALKQCLIQKDGLQGFLNSCIDERNKFSEQAANNELVSELNAFDQRLARRTLQARIKNQSAQINRLNGLRTQQVRLIERLRKACGSKCAKVR